MGGTFAYLFEVRGIQDYVFATGKLRDASGASEIINHLCSGKGCKTGACKSGADKPRAYRNGLAFEVLDKTMPGAVPGCCEC